MKSKHSIFFLCNPDALSNYLSSIYDAKFIITSSQALNKADLYSASALVIFAELNWDGKLKSQFYGIDVLRKLRAERRIKLPVLFCSFLPETYFYSHQKTYFELLRTPGHTFIQLPFSLKKTDIEKLLLSHLDDETLEDIVESFCDVEGLLNEKIHQLKNKVILTQVEQSLSPQEIEQKLNSVVKDSFTAIATLLSDTESVEEIKQRLLNAIKDKVISNKQYDRAVEIIGQFTGELLSLLPSKPPSQVQKLPEKPKWQVLFVDDEEHIRKRVQKEFEQRNINCITASNAEEVFQLLQEDEKTNWITVLIVDYRLQTLDGKWQEKQGYTIIKDIYLEKPNFISFFALTAAHRKALLRIQKNFQMKVFTYSKEDVLSSTGAFNMFSEKVKEEAEKMFDVVCSQPTLTAWHKQSTKNQVPLKNYYRAHRLALDYESAEKDISKQAKEYVDRIVEAYEKNDSEPQEHNYDFQANLTCKTMDKEMLEKFRIRLIGRRIAIGLYVIIGFNRKGIFFAMRKNPVLDINKIPIKNRPQDKSIDALLNTALALSIEDDIPEHLLVEEIAWLKNTMNIDLDKTNRIAYDLLEDGLELFKEKLFTNSNVPNTYKKSQINVTNFKTAETSLQDAFEIANKNRCTELLKNCLRDCLKESNKSEQIAMRVSGIENLLCKFGVFQPEIMKGESEYSIGSEDFESNSDWQTED